MDKDKLISSFFSYATGKLYTELAFREKQELQNICMLLVQQVIYALFSIHFWETLIPKASAKGLQYLMNHHPKIEKEFRTTYKELKDEWIRKNKIIDKEALEFVRSGDFDSEINNRCRSSISNLPLQKTKKGYVTHEEFKDAVKD